MNKFESKYFNTALCMNEALISLLKIKDLEYITIKEICEKAGVNRSTFYLHYETITDLVNETIKTVNERFLLCFKDSDKFEGEIQDTNLDNLILIKQDYLLPYLRFVCENKDVYRAAFRNPNEMQANIRYGYVKRYIIEPILNRFGIPNAYWKYYIAYYIEGTMAIIKEWLNNDCQDSIETIATVIEECIRPFKGASEELDSEKYST